jgi:sugar phosphate permease
MVVMTNKWFSPNERGKILAFGGVGGNLAGVCSPAVFRFLSVSFGGWRGTFIVIGLSGILISMILAAITPEPPMEFNNKGQTSNSHPQFDRKEKVSRSSADSGLTNSLLWVCALSTLLLTLAKVFMSDWMQLYYVQDKRWEPDLG